MPAPAVIPAPRAYVEVVEIKTLVVRMLSFLASTNRKKKVSNFFFFIVTKARPVFFHKKFKSLPLKKEGAGLMSGY